MPCSEHDTNTAIMNLKQPFTCAKSIQNGPVYNQLWIVITAEPLAIDELS